MPYTSRVSASERWEARVLDPQGLDSMLTALWAAGYDVVGPTVRDGAIVQASVRRLAELPRGVGEQTAPGRYRLTSRLDDAYFGYVVGPHSPKQELLVPVARLFRARRTAEGVDFEPEPRPERKLALVGTRSCELAAITVQDRVLLEGPYLDADYAARREDVFVVAVQCTSSASTCFCTSMGTGPRAERGFDLALTELLTPEHRFVVEVGSERGLALLRGLGSRPATEEELAQAQRLSVDTAASITRRMPEDAAALLARNLEHPRWDDVASRCLGCANCTLVCPTCFCTTVEDDASLDPDVATRSRHWDSCFTPDFAYVHGGSVRGSIRSRYRQWLTHKLSSWHAQFGSSGCVGCGRCITFCPVGIDLVEEVAAIARSDGDRGP